MASAPVASGRVALRGDDRGRRKGRGRAEDRADIVRVGDLVEHQHHALRRQFLDRRARAADRFRDKGPGARRRAAAARRWPTGRTISGVGRRHAFLGQSARGIFGGEQLAHVPGRIAQRGGHRMPAIHHDGRVGAAAQGCRGGRARSARAARPARGWRPVLRRSGAGHVGDFGAIAWCLNRSDAGRTASIDLNRMAAHKPRKSRPADGSRPFIFRDQYGTTAFGGECPEWQRGRTVNPLAYAFVGSSPTSPTSLRSSASFGLASQLDREGCRAVA